MPAIQLGITYGRRDAANTPQVYIQNLVIEPNPTNMVDGRTWILRPGTQVFPSPQKGPLRGVFRAERLFLGQLLILSGDTLYLESLSNGTWGALGSVPGSDTAIFAASPDIVMLSANGSAYVVRNINGITYFSTIVMPSNETISWVAYLAGFFVLGVAGSQEMFFMPAAAFVGIPGTVTASSTGSVLTFDSQALAGMIQSGLVVHQYAIGPISGLVFDQTNVITAIAPGTGVAGTSGTITLTHAITVNNGAKVNFYDIGPGALDFFSAETHPGNTVRAMVLSDQLVIFCEHCTEFWQPSGNADLPFSRIVGQGYEKGLAAAQAVVAIDNTLMFVGDDFRAYRVEAAPLGVSNPSIDERLRVAAVAAASGAPLILQAWTLLMDGHAYMVLTIDGQGTFAYDVSTGEWLSWHTGTGPYWACQYGVTIDGAIVIGGNPGENIAYKVLGGLSTDNGLGINWKLSGGIPIIGRSVRLDNVVLFTDAGWGGTADTPVSVNLEISNDQGSTFLDPIAATVGVLGNYDANPLWQMLGQISQPMCVLRFSGTASDAFRISYGRYNEYFSQ